MHDGGNIGFLRLQSVGQPPSAGAFCRVMDVAWLDVCQDDSAGCATLSVAIASAKARIHVIPLESIQPGRQSCHGRIHVWERRPRTIFDYRGIAFDALNRYQMVGATTTALACRKCCFLDGGALSLNVQTFSS